VKNPSKPHVILANGANGPFSAKAPLRLEYLQQRENRNVNIGLPKFVLDISHLPERLLDLLEIASYIFAADRYVSRGRKDAVEYQAWPRSFEFHVRVRDYEFWSQSKVGELLARTIEFMSGDASWRFHFESGHKTPPTGLFDRPGFAIQSDEMQVTLFSGGLDSLCGALNLLESSQDKIVLVSHRSRTGTVHTQDALVEALMKKYHGRIQHYSFECTLRGNRADDETQRTRSFLYTSIAYAIASSYGKNSFYVYENGVTSLNLSRREDLINARSSRTTHPQTMGRMAELLSLVRDSPVTIHLPFLYLTKADVISLLRTKGSDLIPSAVSCTKTFQINGPATHCGKCFQCIDRRIAMHAAEMEEIDHGGLYASDFINEAVQDADAKTTLKDYIRQAIAFSKNNISYFEDNYASEIAEVIDYVPQGTTDTDKISALWALFKKHGLQVKAAISRMNTLYDDIAHPLQKGSLLDIVANREHLKSDYLRFVDFIEVNILPAIGEMFASDKPKNEPDMNAKLGALLRTHDARLRSEYPTVSFACANVIPDHSDLEREVFIEAKYIREGTSPSKASEGISADLTKYHNAKYIVFAVYDPTHRIHNDPIFKQDIEQRGKNRVVIIR
jgi:7-cyano-7-deazaguanine synthase in queuosine biosynthesis